VSPILKVGVAGLGDAGSQVVKAVADSPGLMLSAVADTRNDVIEAQKREHGVHGFLSVEAMCQSPDVDVVYVATPNKFILESRNETASHLVSPSP